MCAGPSQAAAVGRVHVRQAVTQRQQEVMRTPPQTPPNHVERGHLSKCCEDVSTVAAHVATSWHSVYSHTAFIVVVHSCYRCWVRRLSEQRAVVLYMCCTDCL